MKVGKFLGAVFIFVTLLLKPNEAVSNAQRAMGIWYSSVAPALFPFLALMPLLTSGEACAAYEKLFGRWMRPIFRLPGSAAPAVIAGMIAGSPGGAITLRNVAQNSNLTRSEAHRIALAVAGVSPAYLIMGVGQGLHGSASYGLKLAAVQAAVQLFLLIVLPLRKGEKDETTACPNERAEKGGPIAAAVESILIVCGYMVFYSVVAGAIAGVVGKGMGLVFLLLMDLPSGLAALSSSQFPMKSMLQGAAIGFSGLCIISQNMNALKALGIEKKRYLRVRMLSAVLFILVSFAIEGDWKVSIQNLCRNSKNGYALSLLAVGILVVPGLILLSKELFLNKRKSEPLVE